MTNFFHDPFLESTFFFFFLPAIVEFKFMVGYKKKFFVKHFLFFFAPNVLES